MKKTFYYFLSCIAFFTFPLFLANIYYIDDNGRASSGYTNWGNDGRPLADALMKLLFLSSHMSDIFPLPLMLSILLLALCLAIFANSILAREPFYALVLIPLTFFCNPYLLEIFSYRFDVFTLTSAIGLSLLYPCITTTKPWLRLSLGTLILSAIYCLYQTVINIALLMTFVAFFHQIYQQIVAKEIIKSIFYRFFEILLSTAIYLKFILPLSFTNKNEINHPTLATKEFINTVLTNGNAYHQFIEETLVKNHRGGVLLTAIMLVMWGAVLILSWRFLRYQRGTFAIWVVIMALIAPLLALFLIPGGLLFLQNPIPTARAMVAVSGFMLLAAVVVDFALSYRFKIVNWLLILPLLQVGGLYYAYGNVLCQQAKFNDNLVQEIKRDTREFKSNSIYFLFHGNAPQSPIYTNALKNYPVLSVLVPNYFVNGYWSFANLKNNGLSQLWPQVGAGVNSNISDYLCQGSLYAQNQDYIMHKKDNVILIDFSFAQCER